MPAGHKFQRHFGWRHFFPRQSGSGCGCSSMFAPPGFYPPGPGITEQAGNQRYQAQVSQVLGERRSLMMLRMQLTSWMNPRLWRWWNSTPVSAPKIHGNHQGPWLVFLNEFLSDSEREAIMKDFPKPNCEVLTVPKLDQEVKEQLKWKGKNPFFEGEKSLYKIQEQLLDATGPLICLWSDLRLRSPLRIFFIFNVPWFCLVVHLTQCLKKEGRSHSPGSTHS